MVKLYKHINEKENKTKFHPHQMNIKALKYCNEIKFITTTTVRDYFKIAINVIFL